MLVNVVVGFLLEKMVVDAYGDLPQILQREKQQASAEKFQQRRKKEKEERFQHTLEATMKRVLHEPKDGLPALEGDQPVSQLYAEVSQLSCQLEQVSNSTIEALKPDELMSLIQVSYAMQMSSSHNP